MIPDEEAVQRVHAAICEESLKDHMDPDWPGRCVKAVEAAAPHLMRIAWDEGRRVGHAHPYTQFTPTPCPANPYQKDAE